MKNENEREEKPVKADVYLVPDMDIEIDKEGNPTGEFKLYAVSLTAKPDNKHLPPIHRE